MLAFREMWRITVRAKFRRLIVDQSTGKARRRKIAGFQCDNEFRIGKSTHGAEFSRG